jgi:molybdenum cofactor cytidylyltransferase
LYRPKINGLIVAAGLSGRMKTFKPLLPYRGKSFVQNIVHKLNSVCNKIIIVTGYKANEVEENVNDLNPPSKIEFVLNPDFEKGMFTSLQKGISEAKDCDWILYHFVDQPGVMINFYQEFITQIDSKHNWIQPSYDNRHGHPILIRQDLFDLIINSSPNFSLREISKNPIVKKKYWECDYKEIFQDIDTEEDYKSIL